MELLIPWVILSMVVAIYASRKGRSFIFWTIASVLISPLLAFLLVAAGRDRSVSNRTHRRCPACKEMILYEASVCKWCRTEVEPMNKGGFSS
jgi:hypothetical protein